MTELKHKPERRWFIILFFSFLYFNFIIHAAAADGVSFVVNKNVSVETLSRKDIQNIFTGKKSTWENGDKIILVVFMEKDTHKNFLRRYVKRTPDQFKNYWRRMLFIGKGSLPKSFKTEEAVIAFVSKTDGAIGYVTAGYKGPAKTVNIEN